MNILTFDIEDWYNCDFITPDVNWENYEVRIYDGTERILKALEKRGLKATFFCLGWIAEKHPDVIRKIHNEGHHIGCHSYNHQLVTNLNKNEFIEDTSKSKKLIEDLIGKRINAFRAPGFSISKDNIWALEILADLDFEYDCSVFPGNHDYGGFSAYGHAEPKIIKLSNGKEIKEFPINNKRILNKSLIFSGGGYFRFYPYWLIKILCSRSSYLMTYFHSRDFDPEQPVIKSLPRMRKFKSYVGLSRSFKKFNKLLDDFEFINLESASEIIDWNDIKVLDFSKR